METFTSRTQILVFEEQFWMSNMDFNIWYWQGQNLKFGAIPVKICAPPVDTDKLKATVNAYEYVPVVKTLKN